ncbi:MAG: hypothetical protein IJ762_10200 [Bacteroidaceae bacterium]|nr:hypothetical protein [Bacteroidaceae bacterium]
MTQIKRLFALWAVAMMTTGLVAQSNGCNSSYSRFGLGLLSDQSQGFNRSMGGVAQGFRSGTQVNMLNPASYSAIDSLTFIFDAGMGLKIGRIKGDGNSIRVMNTSLEYINAGLRLCRGLGLSFGFVPYSTIGYNFNESRRVGSSYTTGQSITSQITYYGNGGLHQIYLGLGWNPFHKFSIGANISYLWGDYDHTMSQLFYEGSGSSSNTNYNTQNEDWTSDMKTYKLDLGVQYPVRLNKDNQLTFGATATLGHTIGSDVTLLRYTSKGDTLKHTTSKAFDLPYTIRVGASWSHKEQLTIGADYTMDRWSGCKVPMSESTATGSGIAIATDQYRNRHHVALGADYIHHPQVGGKYRDHIHYRIGASYSTSYVKVNGQNGPDEYSLRAGVGLPLKTTARSLINVSAEWLRRAPATSTQIKENYIMLHIGITFNEKWFEKWKFQ